MDLEDFGDTNPKTVNSAESVLNRIRRGRVAPESWELEEDEGSSALKTQWTPFARGNNSFIRCGKTIEVLPPGLYEVKDKYEGEPVYSKIDVKVDDLIPFSNSLSDKVLQEIDLFFNDAHKFKEMGYLHRRGYLFYGPAGCHAKGTQVIMFDGSFKNVEDLQVGDLLMGPDSNPRKVLELVRGSEEMFEITPTKGDSFVINKNHILHLTPTCTNEAIKFPINVNLGTFIEKSTIPLQERFKLTRTNGIHFPSTKTLSLPPYILGLWLGDGNSRDPGLTNIDPEVIDIWTAFAKEKKLRVRKNKMCYTITSGFGGKKTGKNEVLNLLQQLNVINNKHVPFEYLTSSIKERLELIAGLLDTDGSLSNKHYDFINKNEQIADSMVFLCRSVGLAAYKTVCEKGCWVQGGKHFKKGIYYRISISGELDKIPCKISRKKSQPRKQIKHVVRTGFKYKSVGVGDYYGFILNGDHLYLTSDFFIHHNSGKSCNLQQILAGVIKRGGIAFFCGIPEFMTLGVRNFREIEPDRPVLCIFEDIDAIIHKHGDEDLLALLDGEQQIDHVLNIGTTNYPENLDKRIVARPRRFDRIIKINNPEYNIRQEYFKQKLHMLPPEEIEMWARETDGLAFSALAEMIISVICLNIPFADALKILKELATKKISSGDFDEKMGF